MSKNQDESIPEIRSPENKNMKNLPKSKNIYDKYTLMKKSPALNKVSKYF